MIGAQARLVMATDLRRLWPLLVLFGLLTALATATLPDADRVLSADGGLSAAATQPWNTWLMLLVALIAGILVQQESLVGTTAFWLGRPLSRAALLGAKVAFAVLFLVLPAVLAQLRILSAYGLERRLWARAGVEILLDHAPVVLIAMFVAAVTPGVRTFIVVMIAGFIGIGAVDALISWVTVDSAAVVSFRGREFARLGLAATSAVALMAYQYATRRTQVARAAGVAATVVILLGSSSVVSAPPLPRWRPAQADEIDPAAIRLRVRNRTDGGFSSTLDGFDQGREQAFGLFDVTGVPPDHWVRLSRIDSALVFDDGGRLAGPVAAGASYGTTFPRAIDFPAVGRNGVSKNDRLAKLFSLDPDVWRRHAERRGTYTGVAVLQVMRAREVGAIALAPFLERPDRQPAGFADGSHEVRVIRVSIGGDELSVHVRRRSILPRFATPPVHFWTIVNRMRAERLMSTGGGGGGGSIPSVFGGPFVNVDDDSLQFRLTAGPGDDARRVDTAWLEGAELVLVAGHEVERLTRRIEIPGFRLDQHTREAWARRR